MVANSKEYKIQIEYYIEPSNLSVDFFPALNYSYMHLARASSHHVFTFPYVTRLICSTRNFVKKQVFDMVVSVMHFSFKARMLKEKDKRFSPKRNNLEDLNGWSSTYDLGGRKCFIIHIILLIPHNSLNFHRVCWLQQPLPENLESNISTQKTCSEYKFIPVRKLN